MHTSKGKRDRAILAVLLGCGLRRRGLIDLTLDHIQRREDHWAIVDLVGKGGHIRTVPMPDWVKQAIDHWLSAAEIAHGRIFRCVCRRGVVWGTKISEKVVWYVVKEYAERLGVSKLAPHDLRRSCARFCHDSGGELEQIQFLLGHVSVQTTEKYLGCKQRFRHAVNDQRGSNPTETQILSGMLQHLFLCGRSCRVAVQQDPPLSTDHPPLDSRRPSTGVTLEIDRLGSQSGGFP